MSSQFSVEHLEDRQLLSVAPTRVLSAWFDNRGQAALNVSVGLNLTTLSRKTATIMTAGKDGVFGTADDVGLYTRVGYSKGLITLRAITATGADAINAGTRYRVKLNAAVIKDINGNFLDGEFKGANVASGNGVAGGNYDVVTNDPSTARARMTTSVGPINITFYNDMGLTVQNFKNYANNRVWDNSFFHRSVLQSQKGIGVVQGGGFRVNASNQIEAVPSNPGIATQPGHSNIAGTIAMANTGQANSNTNQWYFNATNNTTLDNNYTVFGYLDSASKKVVTAMNAKPITDASGGNQNSPFGELPLMHSTTNIQVPADLLMIYRVSMMVDPSATPNVKLAVAAATPATAPTVAPAVAPSTNVFATHAPVKNSVLE